MKAHDKIGFYIALFLGLLLCCIIIFGCVQKETQQEVHCIYPGGIIRRVHYSRHLHHAAHCYDIYYNGSTHYFVISCDKYKTGDTLNKPCAKITKADSL